MVGVKAHCSEVAESTMRDGGIGCAYVREMLIILNCKMATVRIANSIVSVGPSGKIHAKETAKMNYLSLCIYKEPQLQKTPEGPAPQAPNPIN